MRSFYRYAETDPDRVAVIEDSGIQLSFGELGAASNRISNALLSRGVSRGDAVAALLPNGAGMLVAERAVMQLPLYFVPLNWHLTTTEIAYILADSGARALITDETYLATAQAAAAEAGLSADCVLLVGDPGSEHPTAPPAGREAGQRMLYTSGTTGRPKGVRRALPDKSPEDAAAPVLARAKLYGADHDDGRYLSVAPMYHAAPLAYAVQALDAGHTVILSRKWDPLRALELIEQHGVTWAYLVPLMFQQWLELEERVRTSFDTSSLRSIVHTAAPCPEPVKRAMIEWVGPIIGEIYGGTEGSATFITATDWLRKPGSVGQARAGVTLKILDESGNELPAGEVGRVHFANPGLSFEYWQAPEKTAEAQVDGLTTLGDIGYLDEDGFLFLRDRAADLIVSGGVNIYPAEIEQAILEHPAVTDVAVVGVPDETWGERVHAQVVTKHPLEPDELTEFLRTRLAGFKVPREIEFAQSVPRSEVGKLLRRELRDQLRAAGSGSGVGSGSAAGSGVSECDGRNG